MWEKLTLLSKGTCVGCWLASSISMKKEALWKFPITAVCETLAKKKFNELVRRFEKISEGHQQKPNWSGQNGFFEKRRSIYRASRFSVGINKAPSMSMHGKELPRIYPARIIIVLVVPCELGVDYWSPSFLRAFWQLCASLNACVYAWDDMFI